MYQIDIEKFGSFLMTLRKEKNHLSNSGMMTAYASNSILLPLLLGMLVVIYLIGESMNESR